MGAGTSKEKNEDMDNYRKSSIDSLEAAVNQGILTPEQKEKEERNRKFRARKNNLMVLKELYRLMDPSVKKSGDAQGEVQLSFKYNDEQSAVLVKIIRARDLAIKDISAGTSDPYFKVDLIPDRNKEGAKKTRTVKKSLNPIYNEVIAFNVPPEQLHETRLRLMAYDWDLLGKDDFMGECIINLSELDFDQMGNGWYPLQQATDLSISGAIEISLEYKLPSTMIVTIIQGRDLVSRDISGKSDPFIRCYVVDTPNRYKTSVKHSTLNPVWDETFEFDIPQEEFSSRTIIFSVFDYDLTGKNDPMGDVHIHLTNFDIDNGLHEWFSLADLKNADRTRSQWAATAVVQEFREALTAHAIFGYPSFLFSKNSQIGLKTYSVRSRVAGSTARVQVVDGLLAK
ncbi:Synaptotagmin-1 [Trichoplax sp. H2]|uniref:C2 domain-containing protein n=1 Tax=Trichoplax adhaerens TaxID=10228 RepID=B3RXZ7_TRIAD|nr:predicted protein [Trichoplax adhaerens]EDV24514.1 predicted protein [Trichoplax adhaerens]RDD46807.1 Synaptotagmin-1 [Trichoplax sp. H2]|eukprot:XP_002112404.1 predicted protein [Trichoplax adhaerens]